MLVMHEITYSDIPSQSFMIKVNASLDPVGDPRPGSPWCLALAERGRRRFRAAGRLGAQWQDGGGSWGSHGMKPGPNRTQTQYKGSEVTLYLLPQNLVSEKAQLWQGSNWLHHIYQAVTKSYPKTIRSLRLPFCCFGLARVHGPI